MFIFYDPGVVKKSVNLFCWADMMNPTLFGKSKAVPCTLIFFEQP
jgi:hypothetical protein